MKVNAAIPYVAHVELPCLPQHHSSIGLEWEEFRVVFESLSRNPEFRVIVLSGMGEESFPDLGKYEKGRHLQRSIQECIVTILACVKPVICVSLGLRWTQSIGMIAACDIRISASSASFAIKQTNLTDILSLQLLPKLVGNGSWVFDVAVSGREFDASEAFQVGFISRVVDNGDKALREGLKLARAIATRNPSLVQESKQTWWTIRNIRARVQSAQEGSHDYSEADLAADLDQALGVDKLKRTRRDSEAEMLADLDQAPGTRILSKTIGREKL